VEGILQQVREINARGRPVLVDTTIDYSRRTFFTAGVVRTNLGRLPWPDRLRFIARAVLRKVL
jgi:acetolactate synthase-1/2/3 large subunit